MLTALCWTVAMVSPAWADAPGAESPEVGALIERVEAKYADVEVMQASFTQLSNSQLYGEQTQTGRVSLKRPSKMRWDFEGDGKRFVTDGTTMWIFTPAEKQVLRYRDFGGQASTTDSLLQSLNQLGELFRVEIVEDGAETGHRLSLVPKKTQDQQQVKKLVLTLGPELVIQQVEITDPFDGVTQLSFADVVLGGDVPDSTFTFQVPEGIEVVDAGG